MIRVGYDNGVYEKHATFDQIRSDVRWIYVERSESKEVIDVSDCVFPDLRDFDSWGTTKFIGIIEMISHSPKLRKLSASFMYHHKEAVFPHLPNLASLHETSSRLSNRYIDVSQLPALKKFLVSGGDRPNPILYFKANVLRLENELEVTALEATSSNIYPWSIMIGECTHWQFTPTLVKWAATRDEFEAKYGDPLEILHIKPRAKGAASQSD